MEDLCAAEITMEASPFDKKMPDPIWALFYENLKDRHIWLENEISYDEHGWIIQYIQWLNRRHADDMTPITIHINSPGGMLSTMFSLYSTMLDSKIPIHTINEGMAYSAAVLLFLAGEKRTMALNSNFIIHEGSNMMGGSYRESKASMKDYDEQIKIMRQMIVDRTNITDEILENNLSIEQDWYLRRTAALEYGLITE